MVAARLVVDPAIGIAQVQIELVAERVFLDQQPVRLRAVGVFKRKVEPVRARLEAEGRTVAQPTDSQAAANQTFDQYLLRVGELIRTVGRKPLA